jgi:hypothetical protein
VTPAAHAVYLGIQTEGEPEAEVVSSHTWEDCQQMEVIAQQAPLSAARPDLQAA